MSVESARRAVAANSGWYHSIELAPGVVTPGETDWRSSAARFLPPDLAGQRALDVGTFDGFWAFELERRGADTVAIDVDALDAAEWPPLNRARLSEQSRELDVELGRGFRLAAEELGSGVERVESSVYELDQGGIGGPVDVAVVGAILLHLRDPVRALERVRGALNPRGLAVVIEPFSILDTLRAPRRPMARFKPLDSDFDWWFPNLSGLKAMLWAAGFTDVRRVAFARERRQRLAYCCLHARAPRNA